MENKDQSQNIGVIVAVLVLLVAAAGVVWYFMSEVDLDNGADTEQMDALDPDDESEPTISEFVANSPEFSVLADALEATELVEVFDSDAEYTLFAPTDEAFAVLPDGELEALFANTERFREVLLYHVIEGSFSSDEIAEMSEIVTLQGASINVSDAPGDDEFITLNESAAITQVDVSVDNGFIHVSDQVLLLP